MSWVQNPSRETVMKNQEMIMEKKSWILLLPSVWEPCRTSTCSGLLSAGGIQEIRGNLVVTYGD